MGRNRIIILSVVFRTSWSRLSDIRKPMRENRARIRRLLNLHCAYDRGIVYSIRILVVVLHSNYYVHMHEVPVGRNPGGAEDARHAWAGLVVLAVAPRHCQDGSCSPCCRYPPASLFSAVKSCPSIHDIVSVHFMMCTFV